MFFRDNLRNFEKIAWLEGIFFSITWHNLYTNEKLALCSLKAVKGYLLSDLLFLEDFLGGIAILFSTKKERLWFVAFWSSHFKLSENTKINHSQYADNQTNYQFIMYINEKLSLCTLKSIKGHNLYILPSHYFLEKHFWEGCQPWSQCFYPFPFIFFTNI